MAFLARKSAPARWRQTTSYWAACATAVALATCVGGCGGDDSSTVGSEEDASMTPDAGGGSDGAAGDASHPIDHDAANPGPGLDAGGPDGDAASPESSEAGVTTDAAVADASQPSGSDGGSAGLDGSSSGDASGSEGGGDAGAPDARLDGSGTQSENDATVADAGADVAVAEEDAEPDVTVEDAAKAVDAEADAEVRDAEVDASGPVTYSHDAQPIFMAKCGACHGGSGAGGSNFATRYADTQAAGNTVYCPSGITVGACTLVRIQNGQMPYAAGCTGNPLTDEGNASCLTQAQQNTIQAWISDGQQP